MMNKLVERAQEQLRGVKYSWIALSADKKTAVTIFLVGLVIVLVLAAAMAVSA